MPENSDWISCSGCENSRSSGEKPNFDPKPQKTRNDSSYQSYASATALIREGKKAVEKNPNSLILKLANGDIESITAKNVIDAAKQYDEQAMRIFNDYVKYLAVGIVNVINMFDPEVIILGGGVANTGDFLIKPLKKEVAENILFKDLPYADIRKAELGNDAGIIGAAILD